MAENHQISEETDKIRTVRILICGSRNWSNKKRIGDYLDILIDHEGYLPENITIISGACKGADHHAAMEARGRGMVVIEYPANWTKYGYSAGPKRNQQMLDEGKPDWVVAFHEDIESSKGTRDMVARSRFINLPIEIITS